MKICFEMHQQHTVLYGLYKNITILPLCILVSFEGESLVIIHNIGIYLPIFCTISSKKLVMPLYVTWSTDENWQHIESDSFTYICTYFRSNSCILQSEQQRFLYEICNSKSNFMHLLRRLLQRGSRDSNRYTCAVYKK